MHGRGHSAYLGRCRRTRGLGHWLHAKREHCGNHRASGRQEVRDETPRVGGTSPCALDEIFKTTTGPVWSCATDASSGGGGTPGGATTQVQYNLAGVFAGDAGLTYNQATDILTAVGGFNGHSGRATSPAT